MMWSPVFVLVLLLPLCTICMGAAMSDDEIKVVVDLHNKLRASEGSSNMQKMTWNKDLAYMAQDWTDRCVFEHGQSLDLFGNRAVGQNLYYTTGKTINLTASVMAWYKEKNFYTYDDNSCADGKVCGHYTQVVWAGSNEVGCGYAKCPTMIMLTCNYGPAGNYEGELPYKLGPACSRCDSGSFFCNNGLCDRECTSENPTCVCAAACKNCGKRTDACRCQCGRGWTGVDCSDVCKDTHKYCGRNPGWPRSWCKTKSYVLQFCPALCETCVAGDPEPCA